MTTALIEGDPPAADESPDSIDTWLAVLVRLLHVPPGQREAIRDEIETHLRERVRDLMIGGIAEHDAIRTAISELGEVADLARRFSLASKLRMRRTVMNVAILGVGALTVGAATMIFNGGGQPAPRPSVYESPVQAGKSPQAAAIGDQTLAAAFVEQELRHVLEFIAQAAGLDLVVDHRALDGGGIALDEPITLNLSRPRPVAQVLDLLAAQLEHPFAWRAADGMLEVSTSEVFDRRNVVLASFDVQNVVDLIWSTSDGEDDATGRLESLIVEYIEPEAWTVNGGDLANVSVVGGKMFVKAPARFHGPIEWILGQLEESAAAQASRPARTRSALGAASSPLGVGGGRGFSTTMNRASSAFAPVVAEALSGRGGVPADSAASPSALSPTGNARTTTGLPATGGGGAIPRPADPLTGSPAAPASPSAPPAKGPEQPAPVNEPVDQSVDDPTESQTGSGGGK